MTPIELATSTPGREVKVGSNPCAIAITPDGKNAYVTNRSSGSSDADRPGDEHTRPGNQSGGRPLGIAITPDGKTAYVTNAGSDSVTPIEVATDTPAPEIKVGKEPVGIAITPDGKTAYVTSFSRESVTPIDLATNTPAAKSNRIFRRPSPWSGGYWARSSPHRHQIAASERRCWATQQQLYAALHLAELAPTLRS